LKGIRLDAIYEEFDPERFFLGLSYYEPACSYDWTSVQQSNVISHKHELDCCPHSSHAFASGGFRLAGACAHSIPTRPYPGTSDLL